MLVDMLVEDVLGLQVCEVSIVKLRKKGCLKDGNPTLQWWMSDRK